MLDLGSDRVRGHRLHAFNQIEDECSEYDSGEDGDTLLRLDRDNHVLRLNRRPN